MRHLLLYIMFAIPLAVMAQQDCKFDLEKYRDELRGVVISKADFTEEEADVFFVLYFELRDKERAIFTEGSKAYKGKYMTDDESRKALVFYDDSQIRLKQLQKQYHELMLEHIPASKLLTALRRCEKFSREVYQRICSQKKTDNVEQKNKK